MSQVWVLDALPGEVRSGGVDGQDHPARLIQTLRRLPLPLADRNAVINHLTEQGAWRTRGSGCSLHF